jgi:hypothetical protein
MTRMVLLFALVAEAALTVSMSCGQTSQPTLDAPAADRGSAAIVDAKPTPPGLFCSPGVDPANPLMTDFSAATYNAAKGKWGTDGNLTGTLYSDKDSGSTVSTKVETEAFSMSGQVVPGSRQTAYARGGLQFDSCVNTTTYTGIQFTIAGSTGGCDVWFQLQTYAELPTYAKGGCASYCDGLPQKRIIPRPTPTTILFSDLENTGIPATASGMAAEIVGLRWNVQLAASSGVDAGQNQCSFSLTVDDVKFVK